MGGLPLNKQLTAVALALGIPAGLICGRLAWRAFTRQ
jgi:hypothetical protein